MMKVCLYVMPFVLGIVYGLEHVHHNNTMMAEYLVQVNTTYPSITNLYSIGKSVRGEDLWVLAIGKNVHNHVSLQPHVKYIGNMHGNEVVSRELLLHLIDLYVTSYGTNTTLTSFLDTTVVHIMPSMNPDGYEDSVEGQCGGVTGRQNANNIDLNRNFPDLMHNDSQGVIQPETQAVIDWLPMYNFVLSANLHGGALLANYPYDNYLNSSWPAGSGESECPDHDTYRHICLVYSRSHHTMAATNGSECPGDFFLDGITNGADWYPVAGGMQDYNYMAEGIFEITLEVSCCKFPNASYLEQHWTHNKDALINYLFEVHRGVKGVLRDENNNYIVGAELTIQGRESVPFHTKANGEFYRILMPGQYRIDVSYNDATTSGTFTVTEGEVTRHDITLKLNQTDSSDCTTINCYMMAALLAISSILNNLSGQN
ncbi:carboxypeptidase D-like [Mercenaria mercenaria]|uniref:carboxypeptidase D-like n=1 Tax=Mercenaria mercenaria TaxID=6596 RepID=UPI00234E67DE|nr:carboxypeptidase D-like [Mercenaria mercenaria]XP_045164469.2 carboxypeptidase D-like [Mercenaria mercenaria]